jgi:Family of unknown function (DUF6526)
MSEPQNFKNHGRVVPMYLVAWGLLAINFVWSLVRIWQSPNLESVVYLLTATALVLLPLTLRGQVLTVQDRVIRLEMRLRLARVLPEELRRHIDTLTRAQLVGLRFASDAELPALVRDIVEGRLDGVKEIKMRVKDWQADHLRA